MSFQEAIYERIPVWAQNLMLSAKGTQFAWERYGGSFSAHLARIKQTERLGQSESKAMQASLLRKFVAHAAQTSPYYAETFKVAGLNLDSISSLEDIRRVPVLEKATLRTETDRIRSTTAGSGYVIPMHTSGTTGTPMSVAYSLDDIRQKFAYWEASHNWFGVTKRHRNVRFSGRTLYPNAEKNNIFWRHNLAVNQMLMSSYHLHEANLDSYVETLARYRPDLIDGYPSAIYLIARRFAGLAERPFSPRLVMTTAETLESFQRETIAEAFGCPVRNQYSSSEGAPFAAEDEEGEFALFPSSGILEVVKPGTDEPVRPGEHGDLLVTSFITHAYPLIRYRIGDTAAMDGYTNRRPGFPRILEIQGRQEDYIVSPDRGPVGRLDPVFKKLPPSILESQIVQTRADTVELRYVPDLTRFSESDIELVRKELKARLGNMSIQLVCYENLLPRGKNGKLRAVIGLRDA